ncbi:hypothetical protein [Tenacibaculum haliotis]|uniref:hypothetical protein n=1 Tax=Tenacibaculum haliotis TaxID=1888914 RepID=UPI0021AF08B1|nr:hypothetical protein [Tenacibaculum haliotis]MCT4699024.1 hypothetical protein [Tenacibaculum haliotis]
MKLIKGILIVFVLLFSVLVKAQDEKLPSYFSSDKQLSTLQLFESATGSFSNRQQEEVSTISLKQIGDKNVANINDKFSKGTHKVYQIGDKNNYQFLNYRNTQSMNLGVLQTGNSNLLKIKGTNSLFENLKIAQFGGAKMNIINY